MKNKIFKVTSIILAVLFACTCTAVIAYSAGTDKAQQTETTAVNDKQNDTGITNFAKDETVYVLANADGSVKKVIVSDWIKNTAGMSQITDKSDLSQVINVKGEESYTMNSDNMRVWNADGNDIYSRGETDKALPVNLCVTYKLDGKTVSAEELAGKSGRVSIRFDYQNNKYETVSIDGHEEKIFVPFVMLSGTFFDNEKFKNIEVSNGKVINDGDRTIVVGFALPGMQDNLNISRNKFSIPDYVEISADVTDFSMNTTLTLATNEMFNNLNLDGVSKIDELKSQMTLLTDSMNKLLDGSSKLYDGVSTLLDKSKVLISGINTLTENSGVINYNMQKLYEGLTTLISNNEKLVIGATQTFNSLLSTVDTTLAGKGIPMNKLTIDGYAATIEAAATNPTDAQKTALIASADSEITSKLTAIPDDYKNAAKVFLADMINSGKTMDEATAELTAIMTDFSTVGAVLTSGITPDTATVAYLTSNGYDDQTAAKVGMICSYFAATQGGVAQSYIQTAAAMLANASKVTEAAADPAGSVKINALCLALAKQSLLDTKAQLDSYNEFYKGIGDYTAGAANAQSGAEQLANGTSKFSAGMQDLKDKSSALPDGISQLKDGSMQLCEGLKQFNNEGVQKLVEAVNGDIGGLITRLKATVDVSNDYRSFTGLADGADGNVRFIYKTDEIK